MADKIAVCICTFRRPDGLAELFESLKPLKVTTDMHVRFIIIDNDEAPSAKALVNETAETFPWPLHYVHEPDPGIATARNRALKEAGDEGYLAFLDDDETVSPDWLVELHRIATATKATFVQGPVAATVDDKTDAWWLDTIFFHQVHFEDETPRKESWSNNVLIDLEFLKAHDLTFDPRLRFDGGEDTLFFQDVVRAGGKGVFAANAWVYEVQPKDRLSWPWAIRRQFRNGVTRANTAILRRSRLSAFGYCLIRSAGMVTVGLLHLPTILFRGRRGFANSIALLSRGTGVLFGALGGKVWEYAR